MEGIVGAAGIILSISAGFIAAAFINHVVPSLADYLHATICTRGEIFLRACKLHNEEVAGHLTQFTLSRCDMNGSILLHFELYVFQFQGKVSQIH